VINIDNSRAVAVNHFASLMMGRFATDPDGLKLIRDEMSSNGLHEGIFMPPVDGF